MNTKENLNTKWISDSAFALMVMVLTLLMLALNINSARGDMWLDEIVSIYHLRSINSVDQVFWRINHDNNHFLTSAYLFLVGPGVSPLVDRGLSIVLGAAGVAAAAFATRSRGQVIQIITCFLFATSFFMVQFSSEARGYAGLALATMLAIPLVERRMTDSRAAIVPLVAVTLLGFLSHLTMAAVAGSLIAWVFVQHIHRMSLLQAVRITVRITAPMLLTSLLVVLFVLECKRRFGFSVGGYETFTFPELVEGVGGMFRAIVGLPVLVPEWVTLVAAITAFAASAWFVRDARIYLYVIGVFALPVLLFLVQAPNVSYPRYYTGCATMALLWLGEVIGLMIQSGAWRRPAAILALIAIFTGCSINIFQLDANGRGHPSALVDLMTREGATTYSSNFYPRTEILVSYFADLSKRQARFVSDKNWCNDKPHWYYYEEVKLIQPETLTFKLECGSLTYRLVTVDMPHSLAGTSAALYKLVE